MRTSINLALYPAKARRRVAVVLFSSVAFAAALTAGHLVWARAPASSAAAIRADAALLEREVAAQRARVQELYRILEPAAVRELADGVDIANELIARAAVNPVGLLALLESQAPETLLLERLSLTGSADGMRAELTVRAANRDDALDLIRRLRNSDAVAEVTPVSEQVEADGGEVVLSLLYQPLGDGLAGGQ